ncbi:MAG: translocation/assembly module TamB domain-containing protein [Myxococcales bacterium]|nr:translocation/assembly module TamB domain-containing protein [Myxococcales bacterium]
MTQETDNTDSSTEVPTSVTGEWVDSDPPDPRRVSRLRRQRLALTLIRALRRFFQGTLVLLVLCAAVLLGWLQSDDFQRRTVTLADQLLETALGEQVTISRINARYWPPGLTAVGVHVFHEPTGETILSAERVRIPLRIRMGGGPAIGRLHLQRPTVHLHVASDGKLREFRDMARRPPEQRQPLRRLPFSGIKIIDGTVRLDFADGFVMLDELSATPTRYGTDLSGNVQLKVRDLEQRTHFEWPQVTIGPERIDVPRLALDFEAISLGGRATYDLGSDVDVALTATARLEQAQELLVAPRKMYGHVDLDLSVRGPVEDPVAQVTVSGQELGLDMPGVLTPLLTYEFGDATASATVQRDGADVEQLVLQWGGGSIVGWGRITPDLRLVNGHAVGSAVHLEPLLRNFDAAPTPWVDLVADAEVSAEGTLNPLDLDGSFDFAVADLQVADRPIRRADHELHLDLPHAHAVGSIHIDKQVVRLIAPTVQAPRSKGSAVVDIGLGPRGPLNLEFDLWHTDLQDFVPLNDVGLKGVGAISGRIFGPFNALQMTGEGQLDGFEVLGIRYADRLQANLSSPDMRSIHLEGAKAELGASRYGGRYGIDFKPPISMVTDVTIDRGRVEDLVGMFVELEGLKGDLTGTLLLDGPLFDLDGEGHLALSDVEIYGERFETGEGHGFLDDGRFTLDDLRVRRDAGRAGITLRGSVDRAWALDMELVGDGLQLDRLDQLEPYELPLSGRLSFDARIRNTLYDPSPDGRIRVTNVRYMDEPVASSSVTFRTIDGVAHYTGSVIGGSAKVKGTLGLWDEQPYRLVADLDELPAHLLYPLAANGAKLTFLASGEVKVAGHFGETWSPVDLSAKLPKVELGFLHHRLTNRTPWHYAQSGNALELRSFNLHGGATHLTLEVIKDKSLLMSGNGTVDLDLLRAVVPGLERAAGRGDVTIEAVGRPPNVEAVVAVDVAADLLRHSSAPVTFEDTDARIEVRRDRIDLVRLNGKLGGGTVAGSGHVISEDWLPQRYDLGMQVNDAQVQWVESLPPAIGNGTFSFDGPVGSLLLSGNVDVTDMTFVDRIDWEDWVVEFRDTMLVDPAMIDDSEPLFNLNVAIGAAKTVRLQNNVAEGVASADLRVIGDTVRPGIVGTVTVEEGLAFFQDRQFRIDRGHVLYDDPWTWDPQLDFSLLTDVENRDQRYRVNYQVIGPFSDWRTITRSDPPLPQSDVNALLWFGVTLEELSETGELSMAVAQGVADLLVTDFFISGQAGGLREELPGFLQFDRIDLATGVNVRGDYSPEPRLVVDKRLHDFADLDLTWELNLIRPDETFVSAQKRIGGRWSLSGWYATLQRDRVLPIGGAYGVDVTARWEIE